MIMDFLQLFVVVFCFKYYTAKRGVLVGTKAIITKNGDGDSDNEFYNNEDMHLDYEQRSSSIDQRR